MPITNRYDVLIVGAGQGGAWTAIALRQRHFAGSMALIGEEPELPYERPPLSKEYLSGEKGFDRILIRPPSFWSGRDVQMLTGRRVVAVDPERRSVTCEDGLEVGYGSLIWSAGGRARRLTCRGQDLANIHNIRSRADVDRLVSELPETTRVCVVGGGYIGLEAAAVLTKLGKRVNVIEAQDRVLARVAGAALSRFYEAEHRAQGVEVLLSATVECIEGKAGRVSGVRLSSGEVLPCEMAIVGIGIEPAVQPLIAAGARGGNGVAVDETCRTSLDHVFAIGDCAEHSNPFADRLPIRLESVQNANDMANTVAKVLTDAPEPYHSVPWFWSNQYDLRLQTIGLSIGHDEEVLRGDPANRSFSIVYLKRGHIVALDCVNSTKDYVAGRALVAARAKIPASRLAKSCIPLKEMALELGTDHRLEPG